MQKVIAFWAALCTVLLVALGALGLAFVVSVSDHHTRSQAQGGCQFARVIATLPLPPDPSPTLLQIIAAARIWYTSAECPGGQLGRPDHRVAVYLPKGSR